MNSNRFVLLAVAFLLTILAACGGGGGGTSSNIPGVWLGSVALIEDSCGNVPLNEQYLSFVHLVNQSGTAVTIDNGAQSFAGTTTAEDAFLVSGTRPSKAAGCSETISWRYEKITETQAPFVVRKSKLDCAGGNTCTNTWTGSASHPIDFGSNPIPLYEGAASDAPQAVTTGIDEAGPDAAV